MNNKSVGELAHPSSGVGRREKGRMKNGERGREKGERGEGEGEKGETGEKTPVTLSHTCSHSK